MGHEDARPGMKKVDLSFWLAFLDIKLSPYLKVCAL